ncbi:hypothetical protein [Geoalkalibacter subterraneus]|uniref:FeoB-associated Cys-rich membrane protein n=1 Tax=Geoalkalibacter subterraneus TaxID=483547 RepID=A0A0B5FE28_9BACT|nr:hypothetical protein [Geoalkalibacter subterraneus]AJF06412.1 hypothetical protein GSUB_07445 [Geoalkalibacter subterraneus]
MSSFWDISITVAIIAGAVFYLYRRFGATRAGGDCGCSSDPTSQSKKTGPAHSGCEGCGCCKH